MIERLGFGDSDMSCDGCGKWLNPAWGEDFSQMIAEAKEEGWKITKNRTTGEWEHFCPSCANKGW